MNPFTVKPGHRFSSFDMLVYRLFHRVWSRHFEAYPDLRKMFIAWMQNYEERRAKPLGQLQLVSDNPNPQCRPSVESDADS